MIKSAPYSVYDDEGIKDKKRKSISNPKFC